MSSTPTGATRPDEPGNPALLPTSTRVSDVMAPETGPPATPALAGELFGARLPQAEEYVALLADTGILHGLIGPRERPRLWDRHVLGCAVLTDVIAQGSRVIDIGSGAGLPGLVLAIRRPDLDVTLVEPLHRRVVWLEQAVTALHLSNVMVHEGRADSRWSGPRVDVVTARAVARIGVLAQWSLPLLNAGGRLLALKGASALGEVEEDASLLRAAGAVDWQVSHLGSGQLDPPATVVTVSVGEVPVSVPGSRRGSRTGRKGPAGSQQSPETDRSKRAGRGDGRPR